jgi:hypothetical protein
MAKAERNVKTDSDERDREGFRQELLLDDNGLSDDGLDDVGVGSSSEVVEEQAGDYREDQLVSSTTRGEGMKKSSINSQSVCRPSSLEMSSFEKVSPGINPLFLSQKIDANEPEKKMPSTAAKATSRSEKHDSLEEIHLSAQSAFFRMQGMVSIASKRKVRSVESLM